MLRSVSWKNLAAVSLVMLIGMSSSPRATAATGPQTPPDAATVSGTRDPEGILNLDLEQLAKTPVVVPSMDIPVTSVTKEPSTVGRSAAAVFVITNEMIRRSGATSIPEALRMAPGLEVAQVNSSTWAISARGFNSDYSGKLLVLIDGRTVYNPDFSGVFWDEQDLILEDVDRIEIIRGPGGTLWGANAVNGVINIITKTANETQGAYVSAGGGSRLRDAEAVRYGGRIGEDVSYRVYGKHFERGANYDPTGQIDDAWRQGRFGFRADWEPDRDKTNTLTIQGDHYVGNTDVGLIPTEPMLGMRQTGENLLARWRHVYDQDSDWTLQVYYDNAVQSNSSLSETDKTLDIDFQYRFPLGDRHSITCGAGFRSVDSRIVGGDQFTTYMPSPYLTTNFANQFVQDRIALIEERLAFTLGAKLEQNPYTGLEYEPNVRLLWTPDQRHSAWGAISRAVHTPARAQEQMNVTFPAVAPELYPRLHGNSGLQSESVFAYEIGYREQATEEFSWDLAIYYCVYDQLFAVAPMGAPFPEPLPLPPHSVVPATFINGPGGVTNGVEVAANYSPSKSWRLYAQYSFFHMYLSPASPGSAILYEGNDPCHQVYLRSAWDLRDDLEFDLMARYIDNLAALSIPSYITMDLRLAWRPRQHLELALVGQNLLQEHHWEFGGGTATSGLVATEVPRSVYGTATWRY